MDLMLKLNFNRTNNKIAIHRMFKGTQFSKGNFDWTSLQDSIAIYGRKNYDEKISSSVGAGAHSSSNADGMPFLSGQVHKIV